ncbi:hypothetical protein B0T16DRAFT_501250 [Cercophora newfieldiana]|uniref:Uncharacterized protein n=1 Tax=Cercophora newfieldiana TaxID=92897 RepID=A0AA40CYV5_9PEZI|nr:hypothetical protein B0T16DRAFT_501250 [Cercophora newfieldiana]
MEILRVTLTPILRGSLRMKFKTRRLTKLRRGRAFPFKSAPSRLRDSFLLPPPRQLVRATAPLPLPRRPNNSGDNNNEGGSGVVSAQAQVDGELSVRCANRGAVLKPSSPRRPGTDEKPEVATSSPFSGHCIPHQLVRSFADHNVSFDPAVPMPPPNPARLTPADFIAAGLAGCVRTPGTSAYLSETGFCNILPAGTDDPGPMFITRPGNHTNENLRTPTEKSPFRYQDSGDRWMGYSDSRSRYRGRSHHALPYKSAMTGEERAKRAAKLYKSRKAAVAVPSSTRKLFGIEKMRLEIAAAEAENRRRAEAKNKRRAEADKASSVVGGVAGDAGDVSGGCRAAKETEEADKDDKWEEFLLLKNILGVPFLTEFLPGTGSAVEVVEELKAKADGDNNREEFLHHKPSGRFRSTLLSNV